MFDFSQTIPRFDKECADCGTSFKSVRADETRCTECFYYHKYPEQAPGYFTWTKTGQNWAAIAKWRDHADPPEFGSAITIHRKDGTSSEHRIIRLIDSRYDIAGNRLVYCEVSQ